MLCDKVQPVVACVVAPPVRDMGMGFRLPNPRVLAAILYALAPSAPRTITMKGIEARPARMLREISDRLVTVHYDTRLLLDARGSLRLSDLMPRIHMILAIWRLGALARERNCTSFSIPY